MKSGEGLVPNAVRTRQPRFAGQNPLVNPSFEAGLFGWSHTGKGRLGIDEACLNFGPGADIFPGKFASIELGRKALGGGVIMSTAEAPPADLPDWRAGDIVLNSAPSISPGPNNYAGWTYVPGSGWRPFGRIE